MVSFDPLGRPSAAALFQELSKKVRKRLVLEIGTTSLNDLLAELKNEKNPHNFTLRMENLRFKNLDFSEVHFRELTGTCICEDFYYDRQAIEHKCFIQIYQNDQRISQDLHYFLNNYNLFQTQTFPVLKILIISCRGSQFIIVVQKKFSSLTKAIFQDQVDYACLLNLLLHQDLIEEKRYYLGPFDS